MSLLFLCHRQLNGVLPHGLMCIDVLCVAAWFGCRVLANWVRSKQSPLSEFTFVVTNSWDFFAILNPSPALLLLDTQVLRGCDSGDKISIRNLSDGFFTSVI